MSTNLYIIGNGFDLWHGLPTAYKCYNCFMSRQHSFVHERIGRIYNRMNSNELWSDYENMLPKFDIVKLVENNIGTWCKCSRFDFENAFDTLHNDLNSYFHEWVLQINYSMENKKRLAIDKDSVFLNFNYTNTLERFYGVRRNKICYIHGDTANSHAYRPVVGHGESSVDSIVFPLLGDVCNIVNRYNKFPQWAPSSCAFMQEILEVIKTFLFDLKKKTCRYIEENEEWFANLKNTEDIYVLGHSLSQIDAPYFQRIYNESPKATWHVSYHAENEKESKKQKLCDLLGVSQNSIAIKLFSLDALELKN